MATAHDPARLATHPAQLAQALELQRRSYHADPSPPLAVRRDRLARLRRMLDDSAEEICDAISADFGGRAREETRLLELFTSLEGIRHAQRHLRGWMRTERRAVAWWSLPGRARLLRQPLGVVGIIAPWNYPLFLAVSPLTAALAAGNRVMLKMSEFTPRFGALFESLIARAFSADEVVAVNGDVAVAKAFATLHFDHLLFTGSTPVGRDVMKAASANLTPVTLELGGKSPAIVADGFDLAEAARRLMYGKLLNAGQTCVAPDYALVPETRVGEFVEACRRAASAFYPTLATNPQYTSIVNERQFRRLAAYLEDARQKGATLHPLHDEATDAERRRLSPVAVTEVGDDMRLMQEEIFGPILPVIGYGSIEEAIAFVNARPRPLALYYFGAADARLDAVLERTVAGGVTVNNTMFHVAQEDLPFGGVGPSGMGQYHGQAGFDTFSKLKPVFYDGRLSGSKLLMPPYGRKFRAILRLLQR
jgi:aldehyde dehydrogenase (NAD+)/coniferyl-aldehyde dehydrogenase